MANKFQITISAVDKATAVVNKVKESVGKATRPITDLGKATAGLGKSVGLDRFAKGIGTFASKAGKGISSVVGIGAPMEGLLTGGGMATAGVAAGAAVLATSIAALSAEFGRYSQALTRTSYLSGVSTSQLQSLSGAAKLAGVSAETMQGSLGALGTTMQDALYGRNDQAAAMFKSLGVTIRHTADGTVDAADMFRQLSAALSDADPKAAALIVGILGVDASLIPMMKNLKQSESAARALGSTMGPEQIARAAAFEGSINRLGIAFGGLGRSIADTFIPPLQKGIDKLTEIAVLSNRWWSTHGVNAPGPSTSYAMPAASNKPLPADLQTAPTPNSGATVTPRNGRGSTLGLDQNNPGNLRAGQGQTGAANGYAVFPTQEAGLSAMVRQIQLYETRDGLRSINDIVSKYAPASENNTAAYVDDVSKRTGIAADQQIDPNDKQAMTALVSAMIQHEQGKQPFTPEQIRAAVDQRMASNSAGRPSDEPIKIELSIKDLPQGATAKATSPNASIGPTRVAYSMPTTVTP